MSGARAPLHPDRIREAMAALVDATALTAADRETCLAALNVLRKGQLAVGLTMQTTESGVEMNVAAVVEVRCVQCQHRFTARAPRCPKCFGPVVIEKARVRVEKRS